MRRGYFFLFLFCVVAFVFWRWHPTPEKPSPARAVGTELPRSPDAATAPPPASPTATATGIPLELSPPMPASEIARVVADNSVPGRMVFVDLVFSANRKITATHALGATGRAKPSPVQRGPGHLQYEIYSAAGALTLSGSVEDPLHERFEYEDGNQPGKLRAIIVDHSDGLLTLRLPGEAEAARVVFFHETAASTNGTGREPAGEIVLR